MGLLAPCSKAGWKAALAWHRRFTRRRLRFPSPAWVVYMQEKVSSRYHNNNIYQQLDLLYAFCQWALRQGGDDKGKAAQHLRLWRGSNQIEEQVIFGRLPSRIAPYV